MYIKCQEFKNCFPLTKYEFIKLTYIRFAMNIVILL